MRFAKQVFTFLEQKILQLMTLISLLATYILGIGLTAIVGKLTGKKFLSTDNKKSAWIKTNYQTNLRNMY